MTGVGEDSRGRLLGRPWLIVGFILAIGATLALVLSNDLRWLRLGILAALWAALIGAFLAVKYRKDATHGEDAVAQAQAVYELELEREIAARREFELEIEAEAREQAEADSREELNALRAEVVALRASLQSLFGGEVLYERVALTAQATRMRSLKDQRSDAAEPGGRPMPAQLGAGKLTGDISERPTELIERVIDQASPGRPPAEPRRAVQPTTRLPAPIRAKMPVDADPPIRQRGQGERVDRPAARESAPPRAEGVPLRAQQTQAQQTQAIRPARLARPTLQQHPAARPEPVEQQPAVAFTERSRRISERRRAEPVTGPAMDRVERPRPAPSVPPSKPRPAPQTGPVPTSRPAPETRPVFESRPVVQPTLAGGTGIIPKPIDERKPTSEPARNWHAPAREGIRNDLAPAYGNHVDLPSVPRSVEDTAVARYQALLGSDDPFTPVPGGTGSGFHPDWPEPAYQPPPGSLGGRRHRAEDDEAAAPATQPPPRVALAPGSPLPGGRRRRREDEPPSWAGSTESESVNDSHLSANGEYSANGTYAKNAEYAENGDHAPNGRYAVRNDYSPDDRYSAPSPYPPPSYSGNGGHYRKEEVEPVVRNGSTGRHAPAHGMTPGEQEAARAGSHTTGRSVSELLAAYGTGESTPRRRRRAED